MDKQIKSSLIFNDYKLENINFVLNNNYDSDEQTMLDVKFGTSISIIDHNKANVSLTADINNDGIDKNYPFTLKVSVVGRFTYDNKDLDYKNDRAFNEEFLQICKVNATAALFPYLRSAITDITKAANVDPLVLPLINIYSMIKKSEQQN